MTIYDELLTMGFDNLVAKVAARTLSDADRFGKITHGSSLLPLIRQRVEQGSVSKSMKLTPYETGTILRGIDANLTLGYCAARVIMKYCVQEARKIGFCGCVIRNIDHIGALGVYSRIAALANCVSFLSCAGKPRVALIGGKTPLFGTTPVSIGIPAAPQPIVVDTSLSNVTVNEIIAHPQELLPAGAALNREGRPTVNPNDALSGSLLAIGEQKGASLIYAINVLCHALASTPIEDHPAILFVFPMRRVKTQPIDETSFIGHVLRVANSDDVRLPGSNYWR